MAMGLFMPKYSPVTKEKERVLIVDANTFNFNLRAAHDQIYSAPTEGNKIICIVETGVMVGSTNINAASFVVGDWPPGVSLTLQLYGRLQGVGGTGAAAKGANGTKGGDALYTRYPVTIENANQIWGGGGGGGRETKWREAAGGGGQGYQGGLGGVGAYASGNGLNGTPEAPGIGGDAPNSRGGLGGFAGQAGAGNGPGAAGNAIDGNSFVTFSGGSGDIRGPRIN